MADSTFGMPGRLPDETPEHYAERLNRYRHMDLDDAWTEIRRAGLWNTGVTHDGKVPVYATDAADMAIEDAIRGLMIGSYAR